MPHFSSLYKKAVTNDSFYNLKETGFEEFISHCADLLYANENDGKNDEDNDDKNDDKNGGKNDNSLKKMKIAL